MSKYRKLGLITLVIVLIGMAAVGYQTITAQPGITVTLQDAVVQKKFEDNLIEHRVHYVHPAADYFVVEARTIDQLHNEIPDFYSWSEERLNSETANSSELSSSSSRKNCISRAISNQNG